MMEIDKFLDDSREWLLKLKTYNFIPKKQLSFSKTRGKIFCLVSF